MSKNNTGILIWLLSVVLLLGFCTNADADQYTWGVGYICCSSHVRSKDKDLNEDNKGGYIRYNIDYNNMMIVGSYNNSFNRQSTFVGASPRWRPWRDVEITIPMGVITGYQEHPSLYILPTVSFWDTVNIHVIPSIVYAASFTLIKW